MGGMERIKVIHIITRFDKGGSSENTFLTVCGLDKEHYDIILIKGHSEESLMGEHEASAADRNLIEAKNNGVRVLTVAELEREIHPLNDFKAFLRLISIIRNEKPEIVHTHTSKAGFIGRWAAFFAKVPIIIHTPHGHVFWGYFNTWKTAIFIYLERLTAFITDKIITLTEQEKKEHLKYHIAHDNKFTVIHSGVDLSKFFDIQTKAAAMRNQLGIPQEAYVIGTVGRLTPVKGQKYLIEAAKKILERQSKMVFVFLGDGELMNELKVLATTLGIKDKVRFLGWLPDVAEVMSIFDVFVLPSLNEGMGKVLVEAMATGKPIIASNVSGITDLVIHGENGLLVPPGDSESIAMGIETLYKNPSKSKEMCEKGKAIASRYTESLMIQKIELLYRELLSERMVILH